HTHTHSLRHIHTHSLRHIHTHTHTHTYTHTHTHITHTHTHTSHTHIGESVLVKYCYKHENVCARIQTQIYLFMCSLSHTQTLTHTNTYTHYSSMSAESAQVFCRLQGFFCGLLI